MMQDDPTCELCARQVTRDEVVESLADLNYIACDQCTTNRGSASMTRLVDVERDPSVPAPATSAAAGTAVLPPVMRGLPGAATSLIERSWQGDGLVECSDCGAPVGSFLEERGEDAREQWGPYSVWSDDGRCLLLCEDCSHERDKSVVGAVGHAQQ